MTPLLHLRHLLDFIATRYFSHRDGRRRLDAFLVQEGHAALPHYNYIMERISGLPLTRHSALVQILAGIVTARLSCRLHTGIIRIILPAFPLGSLFPGMPTLIRVLEGT